MSIDILKRLLLFIVLVLAQVLVLNHIRLFGCAVPMLYVYLVVRTNRYYPRWASLLWAFALGLSVDTFSNTPGLAAFSLTLVALLQPYLLSGFIAHDNQDDLTPSMKALGPGKYPLYVSLCVLIFCLVFFTVEAFNFFNWQQWLYNVGGSTLLTILLVLVIDNVRRD